MKKKVIMAMTVVFALCFAITVFALNQKSVSPRNTADCCDKKDSCPMKDEQAKSDKKDCCDKKDDCPMKKQNSEKQTTGSIDLTNVTVAGSDENCCQPGADCCKSGSCCKHKKN